MLDSAHIQGYNYARDTTYRSPRLSRLSPTAQQQAGGNHQRSHPTLLKRLPQPPACFDPSPPVGRSAPLAKRALPGGEIQSPIDSTLDEQEGPQERAQRQVPAAGTRCRYRGWQPGRLDDPDADPLRVPG